MSVRINMLKTTTASIFYLTGYIDSFAISGDKMVQTAFNLNDRSGPLNFWKRLQSSHSRVFCCIAESTEIEEKKSFRFLCSINASGWQIELRPSEWKYLCYCLWRCCSAGRLTSQIIPLVSIRPSDIRTQRVSTVLSLLWLWRAWIDCLRFYNGKVSDPEFKAPPRDING